MRVGYAIGWLLPSSQVADFQPDKQYVNTDFVHFQEHEASNSFQ